ncbi:MAG: 50S ribosomal protein L11 methyltransferase, partial [Bradyrhizobium sp.]
MTSTANPSTRRASFAIDSEPAAKRVADRLTESFLEEAAITAFERPDGRWEVTLHFADPPDEARVRRLVGDAAGAEAARAVAFDTVEARDWVMESLEGLVPVHVGRFVVHGGHDRLRVPANKLGIEIEAALAFGTGHHGTT